MGWMNWRTSAEPESERDAQAEARRILAKYPDRLPVVLRAGRRRGTEGPEGPLKFLAPRSMPVGEFKYVVHKHMKAQQSMEKEPLASSTIYLLVGRNALQTGEVMESVYERYKSEDGFIYMTWNYENTLGASGCSAICTGGR
jgi:GABA(A) receptor-associated protein